MTENSYIPVPRDDIVLHIVDGESLIYDNNKQLIHQLNDTATFIWEHCNGKNSLAEIIFIIMQKYDITEQTAKQDVNDVIANFKSLHLLNE